jgi:SNF2 family DNA or RNA helicase
MTLHESSFAVKITFGQYAGKSLGEIYHLNKSYLKWLASTDTIPQTWRERCLLTLEGKEIPNIPVVSTLVGNEKPTLIAGKNKKVYVTFPYNDAIISRWRYEIDAKQWNKTEKRWEVAAAQLPKVVEFFGGRPKINADDVVKKWYQEEINRRKELDEIRNKKDSEIDIKTLIALFSYQKVAVEFFIRSNGRALCADQMGTGKTAMAIAFSIVTNAKTLIICPKSVKFNWAREILRFAGKNSCIWDGQGVEQGHKNANYHIINYDNVEKHLDYFKKAKFDLLICDEATYLKNYKSKRTKVIFGYYDAVRHKKTYPGIKTKYALLLTGTPILNRTEEAFTLLSFLDKSRFSNPKHFMQRYRDENGNPQNLDELYDRTQDLVIRRLKSQVDTELPEKQRFDLIVEMSVAEAKAYNKGLEELFKKWKLLGNPSAAHMPAIRHLLFEYKWPRIVEFIDEMIDSGRPLLVFAIHPAHVHKIREHYGELCRVIDGTSSTKERDAVIADLKAGKAKIGAFTINAAGMGIDGLQETIDAALFVDRWFVPAIHEQAEDRLHRRGQKNQVQIWYMTVENTIDQIMAGILAEKQQIIDQAVDGAIFDRTMSKSIFKEVVKQIQKQYKVYFEGLDDAVETENF